MNKLTLLKIISVLLLIVNLGMAGFILMQRKAHPGPDKLKFRVIEALKFDPEQVKQYEALILAHRDSMRKGNDAISQLKKELYAQLNGTQQAAVTDSLIAQIGAVQNRIEHNHYEHFLKIRSLCRPDQQANFEALSNELSTYFRPGPQGGKRP